MARTKIRTTHDTKRSVVGPGIGAGIVAAIVMGLFAMIVAAVRGAGFWAPMQLIGALYMGADIAQYEFWSAVLGIGTHLVVGAVFGVVFAALMRRVTSPGVQIAAGLAYGAIVFLVMTYLVLPWANPVMFSAIDAGWFFLYHLAFGLTLPLALPMRRAATARTAYREEAYSRP